MRLPSARRVNARRGKQRGLSAMLVLAVMVLLAGVATYAVSLVTSASNSQAREVAHARTVQVAQTGLDWGRYLISNGPAPQCAALTQLNTLPGNLASMTASVRCVQVLNTTESGSPLRMFRIDVSACNAASCPQAAAGKDYVEHSVSAVVER